MKVCLLLLLLLPFTIVNANGRQAMNQSLPYSIVDTMNEKQLSCSFKCYILDLCFVVDLIMNVVVLLWGY